MTAFRSKTFLACTLSSALLLTVAASRWSLVDWLTPFLMLPVEGLVWLVFGLSILFAVVAAVRHRAAPAKALTPIAVCLVALALVFTVPFTSLWLGANFFLKRDGREDVVRQVISGKLVPNVQHNGSLIALPPGASLSAGGNEVVVHRVEQGPFILFFTFRGILDSAAGFLWVPPGASPDQFATLNGPIAELVPYAPNWYFISMAP